MKQLATLMCLTLIGSTAFAGPPDRPPCQADGQIPDVTERQIGTKAQIMNTFPDPQPVPKCSVIRGCESAMVDLLQIPSGTSSSMAPINHEYHAQVSLDPDGLASQNPHSYRRTEMVRMTADLVSNGQVVAEDVTVMVAYQWWYQNDYYLEFEALDPTPTSVIYGDPGPAGGSPSIRYTFRTQEAGKVNVGPYGKNRHFYFRVKNNRQFLRIWTRDADDNIVRLGNGFPDLPGAQFENVTVTINSPSNQCGTSPQLFTADLFFEDGVYHLGRIFP